MQRMEENDRLQQLLALRAFVDTEISRLSGGGLPELWCSADKTLAGTCEPVLVCGVVHNSGCEPVRQLSLRLTLPEGAELADAGKCPCTRLPQATGLELEELAPGETRAVCVRVVFRALPVENPVRSGLTGTAGGRELDGGGVSLWLTDRSCCRKQAGCAMADALAQWSLGQLFGLSECEIGLLLEYLQEHRDDLLALAADPDGN